ncbi:hypothetical protein B0J13DRAFT_181824 [Dactylonectria estremocensis]|uniref:Uncharacterized protein n=1 Tax=Dactylonectria estremocensis TaxID=1079267 RepID=A0A9P9FAS7_9HYPO|nr:hypothetical protein B0J13DRAFT_181824 [Dactylonectria estremocensis]
MLDTQLIVVTHSWPSLYGAGVGGGGPPALQHPNGAPIEAKAQFDASEEKSLISVRFAKFLLDGQGAGSSTMANYMGIQWRRRSTTDTLETTHLKVVPDMDRDVILFNMSFASHLKKKGDLAVITTMIEGLITTREFGSAMEYGQRRRSPTPMLTYIHKSIETGAQQSGNPSINWRTSSNPVPLGPNQLSLVQAGAASHGIHFMNWETIEALAPMLPRLPPEPRPTPFQGNDSERGADGNTAPSSETLIWESDFEVPGCDQQNPGFQTASPATLPEGLAFSNLPRILGSPGFPPISSNLTESGYGERTAFAQVPPHMSNPDGLGQYEEDHDMDICEELHDQSQKDDFDSHPGHKEWEWDVVRERWRRRGGTTATDWFPHSFA